MSLISKLMALLILTLLFLDNFQLKSIINSEGYACQLYNGTICDDSQDPPFIYSPIFQHVLEQKIKNLLIYLNKTITKYRACIPVYRMLACARYFPHCKNVTEVKDTVVESLCQVTCEETNQDHICMHHLKSVDTQLASEILPTDCSVFPENGYCVYLNDMDLTRDIQERQCMYEVSNKEYNDESRIQLPNNQLALPEEVTIESAYQLLQKSFDENEMQHRNFKFKSIEKLNTSLLDLSLIQNTIYKIFKQNITVTELKSLNAFCFSLPQDKNNSAYIIPIGKTVYTLNDHSVFLKNVSISILKTDTKMIVYGFGKYTICEKTFDYIITSKKSDVIFYSQTQDVLKFSFIAMISPIKTLLKGLNNIATTLLTKLQFNKGYFSIIWNGYDETHLYQGECPMDWYGKCYSEYLVTNNGTIWMLFLSMSTSLESFLSNFNRINSESGIINQILQMEAVARMFKDINIVKVNVTLSTNDSSFIKFSGMEGESYIHQLLKSTEMHPGLLISASGNVVANPIMFDGIVYPKQEVRISIRYFTNGNYLIMFKFIKSLPCHKESLSKISWLNLTDFQSKLNNISIEKSSNCDMVIDEVDTLNNELLSIEISISSLTTFFSTIYYNIKIKTKVGDRICFNKNKTSGQNFFNLLNTLYPTR